MIKSDKVRTDWNRSDNIDAHHGDGAVRHLNRGIVTKRKRGWDKLAQEQGKWCKLAQNGARLVDARVGCKGMREIAQVCGRSCNIEQDGWRQDYSPINPLIHAWLRG